MQFARVSLVHICISSERYHSPFLFFSVLHLFFVRNFTLLLRHRSFIINIQPLLSIAKLMIYQPISPQWLHGMYFQRDHFSIYRHLPHTYGNTLKVSYFHGFSAINAVFHPRDMVVESPFICWFLLLVQNCIGLDRFQLGWTLRHAHLRIRNRSYRWLFNDLWWQHIWNFSPPDTLDMLFFCCESESLIVEQLLEGLPEPRQ